MKDKVLYLHIGTHKTGTSALQILFQKYEKELEQAGILYPKTGRSEWGAHHYFFNTLKMVPYQHYYTEKKFVDYVVELEKESESFNNVLLSSEILSEEITYESLFELKKIFSEIKIIVFVRRQDRYLESSYSSFIRGGYTFTFKNFLLDRKVEYHELLNKFSGIFGKENVMLYRYDKRHFANSSIFEYFLQLINVEIPNFHDEKGMYNTSMNFDSLEFIRLCNLIGFKAKTLIEFCNYYSTYLEQHNAEAISLFTKEERLRFLSKYRSENELILQEYLPGDNELFNNDLNEKENSSVKYMGFNEASFKAMIDRMRSFDNKLFVEICSYLNKMLSVDLNRPKAPEQIIRFLYMNTWN